MAKKIICEILATVKGLNPKDPTEYTHAGTADAPTLIELEDTPALKDLITSGTVRIYPGPVAPAVTETDKVKTLQAKLAECATALENATAVAEKYAGALITIQSATELQFAVITATEALV